MSKNEFIQKASKLHGECYLYDKTFFNSTKDHSIITCKKHGDFTIKITNFLYLKQGCKKCYLESIRLSKNKILERIYKKHNGIYKYADIENIQDITTDTNITIICPTHGNFVQSIQSHMDGHGCSKCGHYKVGEMKRYSFEEFESKSNRVHKNKYTYCSDGYKDTNDKIKIICPTHGEYSQSANSHLNGCGCPFCSPVGNTSKKMTTESFIERAKEIHKTRYLYDFVEYINSHTKVSIKCQKHGIFLQEPASHLYGKSGCPKCKLSKSELLINDFLQKNNINFISQYKFDGCLSKRKLPFDFYIPSANLVIEYQGEQHYAPMRYCSGERGTNRLITLKQRDEIKKIFCIKNNVNFLEITYLDNILDKLNEMLNLYFQNHQSLPTT